jgi:hypothetical protein
MIKRCFLKEGLAMKTKRKFSLIITMMFIFTFSSSGQETKSFLSIQDILSTWQSKVAYSEKIINAEPSKSDPNITQSLVKFVYVETIEEGRKFISRLTPSEKGFADINSVEEIMFDGIHQKRYIHEINQGQIFAGLIHKSAGTNNRIKRYFLSEPYIDNPGIESGEPVFARTIKDALTDPNLTISVRPELEEISGQMCHVLDIEYFKNDKTKVKASTIWVAHEKGMLPMKLQIFGPEGGIYHERTVDKIDFAGIENRGLWYPKKAYELFNEPQSIGVITYEFNVFEFVPNIKTYPNTFRLDFPNGTQVNNAELGISYTVGVK